MSNNNYTNILKILSEGTEQSIAFLDILNAEISMPNIKFPTMGGLIFWTDIAIYNGWRLQQNDITHHARILDNNDVRVAWGTINGMYRAMDRLVHSKHKYDTPELDSSDRLNSMEELKTLKELLDIGAITENEFLEKKAKILKKL